jgi:hypothetical protein
VGRSGIFFIPRHADRCPQSPHQPDRGTTRQGNQGQTPRLFGLGLKMAGTDHALRKRVRRSENGYAAMGVGLTGGHAGGLAGGWRGARGAAMAEMHCGNARLSKSRKRLLDIFVAAFGCIAMSLFSIALQPRGLFDELAVPGYAPESLHERSQTR